jgi:dTDP-4-dehydrorhamnose 3,5-epimerase
MRSIQTLHIQAPRVVGGDWEDAREQAEASLEPVFVPRSHHSDDRGWSLMNLLQGVLAPEGQVNFSVQYPGVVKAWHRHEEQTDFWCCVMGHIKAGVFREEDGELWSIVLGEKRPGVLVIPPPLWHGAATVGMQDALLCYYVTKAYNPLRPDEQRRPWDSVPGPGAASDFWEVQRR